MQAPSLGGLRPSVLPDANSKSYLWGAVLSLVLIGAGARPAPARTLPSFTQHRINELAAGLEKTRYALIEDTRQRQPGEKLPVYLTRLVAPLPGETAAQHKTRLTVYLAALSRASEITASARQVPALRDGSSANRAVWDTIARAAGLLPNRLKRLRARLQREEAINTSANADALGIELFHTLWPVLVALDALRDARP